MSDSYFHAFCGCLIVLACCAFAAFRALVRWMDKQLED